MKKITIELTERQLDALEEIVGLGSEDASLSYQSGAMEDDDYEEFIKEVESPAIMLLQEIRRNFEAS